MANKDLEKLIDQALWEAATPPMDLAARLGSRIDSLARNNRQRKIRLSWTMGSVAASILVAGIVITDINRRNDLYERDTFDNPVEAAQFMASMLGNISHQINDGIDDGVNQFINELNKVNESSKTQKPEKNES